MSALTFEVAAETTATVRTDRTPEHFEVTTITGQTLALTVDASAANRAGAIAYLLTHPAAWTLTVVFANGERESVIDRPSARRLGFERVNGGGPRG